MATQGKDDTNAEETANKENEVSQRDISFNDFWKTWQETAKITDEITDFSLIAYFYEEKSLALEGKSLVNGKLMILHEKNKDKNSMVIIKDEDGTPKSTTLNFK